MPYHITHGTLPACDLKEYDDTGVVVLETGFTPRQVIKEKTGHIAAVTTPTAVPASYQHLVQVQVHKQALDIDQKMEIIPTAAAPARAWPTLPAVIMWLSRISLMEPPCMASLVMMASSSWSVSPRARSPVTSPRPSSSARPTTR